MQKNQTKRQSNAPATKKDIIEVRVGLEGRMENLEERLEKKMKDYHNEVMTELDSIAGAIKKFDEEQTVLAYRQANHSDRMEKLETSVFGKPSE